MLTWEDELAAAVELAEAAAAVALPFRHELKVTSKQGGEPVTQADLAANDVILEGLAKRFPRDAILSEETPSDPARLDASRVWIIDPIDGTREFIAGTNDFAVQIGLAVDGIPVVGVVYQCAIRRLFLAARDRGAWVEDPMSPGRARRKLSVSHQRDPNRMRLTVSRWHRSKKQTALREALRPAEVIPAGSIGVKMGLVALGEADIYLHPSAAVSEWDTCGPEVILREAGGKTTDLFDAPLLYNQATPIHSRGIAASNGAAHSGILHALAPVVRSFGYVSG